MNRKFLISGGMLAIAAAAAAVAIAAPGQMGKADTDGDGALSKTEVAAMANTQFARMDANGDGQIDEADRAARHKARFGELDADKNGQISEAEFMAAHSARAEMREERRQARMDEGPGEGEARKGRGHRGGAMMFLKMADANNDRAVTKAEMTAAIDTHFAKADTDKDGKISTSEAATVRKAMREKMKAVVPAT